MLRRELAAYSRIRGPFIPEFFGGLDEDDEPLLAIEDLSGARWPPPWDSASIDAVLDAIDRMHNATAAVPP